MSSPLKPVPSVVVWTWKAAAGLEVPTPVLFVTLRVPPIVTLPSNVPPSALLTVSATLKTSKTVICIESLTVAPVSKTTVVPVVAV